MYNLYVEKCHADNVFQQIKHVQLRTRITVLNIKKNFSPVSLIRNMPKVRPHYENVIEMRLGHIFNFKKMLKGYSVQKASF